MVEGQTELLLFCPSVMGVCGTCEGNIIGFVSGRCVEAASTTDDYVPYLHLFQWDFKAK